MRTLEVGKNRFLYDGGASSAFISFHFNRAEELTKEQKLCLQTKTPKGMLHFNEKEEWDSLVISFESREVDYRPEYLYLQMEKFLSEKLNVEVKIV